MLRGLGSSRRWAAAAAASACSAAAMSGLRHGSCEERATPLTKEQIFEMRKQLFCGAQSVSYANTNPLWIVRGKGQYLYDEKGTAYLDTRNNVAHLGHTHPRVVKAVQDQVATLNTNTRYLHQNLVQLASKLVATMPKELCVCFFVNSGSEANDLAIRLARAHTKNKDIIVVDRAYHGHTVSVLDISPYKYEHTGGPGKPDWVHQVICPDTYRGPYRVPRPGTRFGAEHCKAAGASAGAQPNQPSSGAFVVTTEAEAAERYAAHVAAACTDSRMANGRVAAFFVESGMSVAGVIVPPAGYLRQCYAAVRAAGGVCVADEVQTGFGRFGEHYWGFQQQRQAADGEGEGESVVPDIVTMGKPFGNGMPLAAVVCTREVADSFGESGLEYFNTFGGNPVACAAGLATMEVVEEEGLQEHAKEVGEYIRRRVAELGETLEQQSRQPQQPQRSRCVIGDVRGSGLFIGIEFVRDRVSLEAATAETSMVCSRLKDEHMILTSIDGPHDNVLVLKPPMVFSKEDADTVLAALSHVLSTLGPVDHTNATHTPT